MNTMNTASIKTIQISFNNVKFSPGNGLELIGADIALLGLIKGFCPWWFQVIEHDGTEHLFGYLPKTDEYFWMHNRKGGLHAIGGTIKTFSGCVARKKFNEARQFFHREFNGIQESKIAA